MCGYHSNISSSSATLGVCGKGGGERPGLCDHTGCSGTGEVTCGMMGQKQRLLRLEAVQRLEGSVRVPGVMTTAQRLGLEGEKPYPY